VVLPYCNYNTSNKKVYTKSSKIIIWDIKECHFDNIFEYDLHSVVHYIK
jgi:hypothetical protein